jgi:hypothetical protein
VADLDKNLDKVADAGLFLFQVQLAKGVPVEEAVRLTVRRTVEIISEQLTLRLNELKTPDKK